MKPTIVTIGVYGFSEEAFFDALRQAGVDTFADIRRRRGVRGREYPFANSQRLQRRLADMGIRYLHRLDLAPTAEIRQRQAAADQADKIARRKRTGLARPFVEAYQEEVLSRFEPQSLLDEVGPEARVVALFCVEREPAACHRSLVAARLHEELGLDVKHIVP